MQHNMSNRDSDQVTRFEHDEENNAKRVMLVGGEIFIPEIKFPENLKFDSKVIEIIKEVPVIVEKIVIKEVEKPIIVEKQVQVVQQVPVFKDNIIYKEIQVPVIVKELEVKEIEKIVFVDKYKEIDKPIIEYKQVLPTWAIALLTSQAIGLIVSIALILKK